MTASNSFEYYCHNEMKDKKLSLTQEQFNTLKEIYVERLVDNMTTKDLVTYVFDDMTDYVNKQSPVEFFDDAKNWLADDFTDTIQEVLEIHPNKE